MCYTPPNAPIRVSVKDNGTVEMTVRRAMAADIEPARGWFYTMGETPDPNRTYGIGDWAKATLSAPIIVNWDTFSTGDHQYITLANETDAKLFLSKWNEFGVTCEQRNRRSIDFAYPTAPPLILFESHYDDGGPVDGKYVSKIVVEYTLGFIWGDETHLGDWRDFNAPVTKYNIETMKDRFRFNFNDEVQAWIDRELGYDVRLCYFTRVPTPYTGFNFNTEGDALLFCKTWFKADPLMKEPQIRT